MTLKETLYALLEGKKMTSKLWNNDYIYFNEEDNKIEYPDNREFHYPEEFDDTFYIRYLDDREMKFLKTYLESYKNADKVTSITISNDYISLYDSKNIILDLINLKSFNLEFKDIERYAHYSLKDLGLL